MPVAFTDWGTLMLSGEPEDSGRAAAHDRMFAAGVLWLDADDDGSAGFCYR